MKFDGSIPSIFRNQKARLTSSGFPFLSAVQEKENAERRVQSLDRIIRNLYEDKVNGTISDERFRKLSQEYEDEQSTLKERIQELQAILNDAKEQSDSISLYEDNP